MMAVAAAQKNREMFAMKKSYSIEVSERKLLDRRKNQKRNGSRKIVFKKLINFESSLVRTIDLQNVSTKFPFLVLSKSVKSIKF